MMSRPPASSDLGAATQALLTHASMEISGHDLHNTKAAAIEYCRGKLVFLPWTPNLEPVDMLAITATARRLGLLPVPHLTARRLTNEAAAQELLTGLVGAGAEAVLLIGGDVRDPLGPYRSSLELLRSGVLQRSGIRKLGVAGYPEGHPSISDGELRENLELKLDYALCEGLEAFVVSQFCFDAQAILDWARQLRARGITATLRVGVAGPTHLTKLVQLALRCGVGNSIRALKGRMGSMTRLVTVHEPGDLVGDLAAGLAASPEVEPLGLHLFALGGLEATSNWLARALVGPSAHSPRKKPGSGR